MKILSFESLNQKKKRKEKKKKKKLSTSPLSVELGCAGVADRNYSPRPRARTLLTEVNFTTYFISFSRDKMPIYVKMLMFSLGNCVRTAAKTMLVDRKKEKALALLYLASGPLRSAANSSVVPTEFAAKPTTKIKSSKANS